MNLIIVESPHKATQIQGYLGTTNYKVISSKGHIRDLEQTGMSVDIEHGFTPKYVVPADKKAVVHELGKLASQADIVYLASDPDREGEAIAWHIADTLNLDPSKIRRIAYNEVTKTAVQEALANPRSIDMDLVNAQQARRVLDRLVGFELSPVLWRKIRRGLSAGRVQSATLRLVVDREREIAAFVPQSFYKVEGRFTYERSRVKGTLDKEFSSEQQAREFLQDSIGAAYSVSSIDKTEGTRTPSAPFTTSTMQQEAARKLHFSSSRTMRVAQTLYEKGLITYMRTDSTNLSGLALGTAKQYITETFGAEYSRPRNYQTRSRGAQEAHEAIRPTFIANTQIQGTPDEQKLYSLIWKRTVASQMAEAKVLNTLVKVGSDKRSEKFGVRSTQILFDGFLKLYMEGTDDASTDDEKEVILPEMHVGDALGCTQISADCKYTQPPFRYSEATLIKKMEELGIGRPSTYAATITVLTKDRGYIVTADKEGTAVQVTNLLLKGSEISQTTASEKVGAEKRKLVPSEIGTMVTDYLQGSFSDIIDYDFTAKVEDEFDQIAAGKIVWNEMIGEFYSPFHAKVDSAISDRQFVKVERVLGADPLDGKVLVAKMGPYGAYVQKGDPSEKMYANLSQSQLIESITLEEALKLFELPRTVGEYQGQNIVARDGRYGPFIKWGEVNASIPRGKDPRTITLEECVALIDAKSTQTPQNTVMKEWEESGISVVNGRYGPYIKQNGTNYKIPKGTDAAALTEEGCKSIIASTEPTNKSGKRFSKKRR